MRILYIADNRNRHNWGCRATSAALSEMLAQEHQIVGRISGKLTLAQDFLYLPVCDGKLNRYVHKHKMLFNAIDGMKRKVSYEMFEQFDFLSEDFDKSIINIKEYAKVNKKFQEINLDAYKYDAIVINGEGTMIMTSPPRRDTYYYLLFAYWAKKRGKKVFFVNAMFSDCPQSGRNEKTFALTKKILSKSDIVMIRDPLSYEYAKKNLKLSNCRYVPDALFTWKKYINESCEVRHAREILPFGYETDKELATPDLVPQNYICISGSSAAKNTLEATKAYMEMVYAIKNIVDCPIYLVQTCDGDSFLEKVARATNTYFIPVQIPVVLGLNILANASLFISGRYHPSIMASLGGTPCIFLGANSHKNMGLQEMLQYNCPKEYHACPTQEDIIQLCKDAADILKRQDLRKEIKEIADRRAVEGYQILEYIK